MASASFDIGIRLTAKQEEMKRAAADPARHVLFPGGARAGKTFLIIFLIILRAILAPGSRHLICRHRFNHAKVSIWLDTLPRVLRFFPRLLYSCIETDHVVKFVNGSEIWVDGLDEKERVDKILGREYATIFFNECSQIRWTTVSLVLTRLAQKVVGIKSKCFYDLNPVGRGHWTFRIWFDHVDPMDGEPIPYPEGYVAVFSTAEDNRDNLADDYIERELSALKGARRARFLDGQYQDDDGNLVFPIGDDSRYAWAAFEKWREAQHAEDLRTVGGLDLGFEDCDAFALIVYSVAGGPRWLVYEYKERHNSLDKLAQDIKAGLDWLEEKGLPPPLYIYADSGGGGARSVNDLSRIHGVPVHPAYKQDKASAIELLRDDLRMGDLMVPADGILAAEAARVAWALDEDTGRRKIDDSVYHPDLVDAVLYAMRYIWLYETTRPEVAKST